MRHIVTHPLACQKPHQGRPDRRSGGGHSPRLPRGAAAKCAPICPFRRRRIWIAGCATCPTSAPSSSTIPIAPISRRMMGRTGRRRRRRLVDPSEHRTCAHFFGYGDSVLLLLRASTAKTGPPGQTTRQLAAGKEHESQRAIHRSSIMRIFAILSRAPSYAKGTPLTSGAARRHGFKAHHEL